MFSINDFIMKTLKGMIGNYPDFQVQEYALNWYSKGKITEEDLQTIDDLINEYNESMAQVEDQEDTLVEDQVEE